MDSKKSAVFSDKQGSLRLIRFGRSSTWFSSTWNRLRLRMVAGVVCILQIHDTLKQHDPLHANALGGRIRARVSLSELVNELVSE